VDLSVLALTGDMDLLPSSGIPWLLSITYSCVPEKDKRMSNMIPSFLNKVNEVSKTTRFDKQAWSNQQVGIKLFSFQDIIADVAIWISFPVLIVEEL
jgi:hypothetical protein